MMVAFYIGCGVSLIARVAGAVAGRARSRAVRARHLCRDLSSGRHRDGDRERDPSRPDHGVQRRLRQSRHFARRRYHRDPDRRVVVAWRIFRARHRLRRDRHRLSVAHSRRGAAQVRAQFDRRCAAVGRGRGDHLRPFHRGRAGAGLVFNTLSVALPKIVDERVSNISLVEIGGLTTAVFICGAIAQMAVGRLVERFRLHILFAVLAVMQFAGVVWTAYASGVMVLFALAFTMAAIYGQITVNDLIIARYTADAWRGRVFAVRYFLTFMISGIAVSMIALLYGRGGFPLVLGTTAFVALGFLIAVLAIAYIAANVERDRVPHAMPAE